MTYTTDTRPVQSIIDAATGADLFICEGMYGEDDKKSKAVENKHMLFSEAAHIAAKARPKKMWLTHYSPSVIYPDGFVKNVRKIFSETYAGKDGMSEEFKFEED